MAASCGGAVVRGPRHENQLLKFGILTIGDLAITPAPFLRSIFGKVGDVLHCFANGLDQSPVMRMDEESLIKSIGNSTTTPRILSARKM